MACGNAPLSTVGFGAFEQADDLWACVLGNVEDFVNINGGIALSDYDCTTVRPKWNELRFALTKGCVGFTDDLEEFTCQQAEPCQ